jgi:hypothetical protein
MAVKARWVQQAQPQYTISGGILGGVAAQASQPGGSWMAVDEDDLVLAVVDPNADATFSARIHDNNPSHYTGSTWYALFTSLDGAKRRVQKQLGSNYDFSQQLPTAWAARSMP